MRGSRAPMKSCRRTWCGRSPRRSSPQRGPCRRRGSAREPGCRKPRPRASLEGEQVYSNPYRAAERRAAVAPRSAIYGRRPPPMRRVRASCVATGPPPPRRGGASPRNASRRSRRTCAPQTPQPQAVAPATSAAARVGRAARPVPGHQAQCARAVYRRLSLAHDLSWRLMALCDPLNNSSINPKIYGEPFVKGGTPYADTVSRRTDPVALGVKR